MTKEKKQMLVLGVLVLVVLAVGAFQFLGPKPKSDGDADEAGTPKDAGGQLVAENTGPDPVDHVIRQLLDPGTAPRDPFVPQAVVLDEEEEGGGRPPFNQSQFERPDPEINTGGGTVRPYDPTQGGENPTGIEQSDPLRLPGDAPYALRGVMLGAKNMAMFENDEGDQFLALEGELIGGGFTVLAISEKEVVLKHKNGKVTTLALLGGN